MLADSHQPTLLDYGDTVGALYRGQTVGDDQSGAPRHQAWQGLLDQVFALGIQGAGGLVQQQNGGIHQQRPGNGQALALTAGKPQAGLAQVGLVAVGQLLDKVVGMGGLGGGLHLGVAGAGFAVADIVRHRTEEQRRIL